MRKNLFKHGIQLAVIVSTLIALSVSASAFWPYHGIIAGWYGDGCYSNYSQESVPYYALHPPVYYSYPVARTYGLYPFPYSSEVTFAQPVVVEPKLVINRYVEQNNVAETDSLEPQPLRIANPFVEGAADLQTVRQASWETPKAVRPKIIHPHELTAK